MVPFLFMLLILLNGAKTTPNRGNRGSLFVSVFDDKSKESIEWAVVNNHASIQHCANSETNS